MLLAGDSGGTKTILALFDPAAMHEPRVQQTYRSAQFASLSEMVRRFLDETGQPVERASFGVAGPVVGGRATITNLSWEIDADAMQQDFGFERVHLLNDLQAVAAAVPHLTADDLQTINVGAPVEHGAMAVIAPGTGLGEAFLIWDGKRYRAFPSEGGHSTFAPTNQLELDLLSYLWAEQKYRHVSYERVCSGIGLPNIYRFLRSIEYADEPAWLAEQLEAARDPTPVIVDAALQRDVPVPLCVATVDMFVAILGAETANLGLKVLATGGIYLGGGIPPRMLTALQGSHFRQAFLNKGRFGEFVGSMPVHVIMHPQAALLGTAYDGLNDD